MIRGDAAVAREGEGRNAVAICFWLLKVRRGTHSCSRRLFPGGRQRHAVCPFTFDSSARALVSGRRRERGGKGEESKAGLKLNPVAAVGVV